MKFTLNPRVIWSSYFSSVNAVIRAGLGMLIVLIFVANYVRDEPLDLFTRLESLAYDARLRATMPEKIDPRIVIIDIDEKSLAAEGRMPWGRDKMAAIVRQSFDTYKVKVLGFDVIFAEPDISSGLAGLEALGKAELQADSAFQQQLVALRQKLNYDQQFADEIKKHSVVLSFSGQNNFQEASNDLGLASLPPPVFEAQAFKQPPETLVINGYSGNLTEFQDKAAATGHILPILDADGVLRRIPMFVKYKNDFYESMSAAVYRTYLDNAPVKVSIRDDEGDKKTKFKYTQIGNTLIPLDEDGAALVPYRGNSPMFRYISATDVIRGKLNAGELDGKIALVGTTAQGLFDLRNTPVSSIYPGVEVHANMISGYLDSSIKQLPPFQILVKVLIILVIGLPLSDSGQGVDHFGDWLAADLCAGQAQPCMVNDDGSCRHRSGACHQSLLVACKLCPATGNSGAHDWHAVSVQYGLWFFYRGALQTPDHRHLWNLCAERAGRGNG